MAWNNCLDFQSTSKPKHQLFAQPKWLRYIHFHTYQTAKLNCLIMGGKRGTVRKAAPGSNQPPLLASGAALEPLCSLVLLSFPFLMLEEDVRSQLVHFVPILNLGLKSLKRRKLRCLITFIHVWEMLSSISKVPGIAVLVPGRKWTRDKLKKKSLVPRYLP